MNEEFNKEIKENMIEETKENASNEVKEEVIEETKNETIEQINEETKREIKEEGKENRKRNVKEKSKLRSALEWTYCIIIAIVLALLFRYYIGTPTVVKQVSMYPTLEQNQRLWLNRWGRTTHTLPNRGDIITFEEPSKISYSESEINLKKPIAKFNERTGWDWFVNNFLEMGDKRSYIKRVIGLPGEHVKIENGKVYINGKELYEDYLQPGVVTDVVGVGFSDFTVPENCVFAMGDNRNHSTDCRAFGCVPIEKIESTVAFRFWPFDKFGAIEPVK